MRKKSLVKWFILSILIVATTLAIVKYHSQLTVGNVESWVNKFGILGPIVFMSVFIIAPVLFLPGSIFALAGGALFGPVQGTLYNLTAATIGATLAFFIARYLASDWIAGKVGGKLKEIIDGVNAEGWRFVAFVRLVPLFPFNLLNYSLGLTKIESRHYIVATLICMSPGSAAYTYLGYVGREAIGGGENLLYKGLLALSLLAALTLLPGLVKRFFPALSGSGSVKQNQI